MSRKNFDNIVTEKRYSKYKEKLLSYSRKKKPASRQLFFIRSKQFCEKIIHYGIKQIPFDSWFFNLF